MAPLRVLGIGRQTGARASVRGPSFVWEVAAIQQEPCSRSRTSGAVRPRNSSPHADERTSAHRGYARDNPAFCACVASSCHAEGHQ
jgi:hypothetical protein